MCLHCGLSGHIRRDCPETADNLALEENSRTAPALRTITTQQPNPDESRILAFRGENHPLSNLYLVEKGVEYDRTMYPSVEHAYKSAEASYFTRDDLQDYIRNTKSALSMMKHVNRELEFEEREEWLTVRQGIMRSLLASKYESCPQFRDCLMSSEDKCIVEATNNKFWASGIPGTKETISTPSIKWTGQNKLGQMLMDIRKEERERSMKETNPATSTKTLTNITETEVQGKPEITQEDKTQTQPIVIQIENSTTVIDKQPANSMSQTEESMDNSITSDNPINSPAEMITTVILGDCILSNVDNRDKSVKIYAKPGYGFDNTKELVNSLMEEKLPNLERVVLSLGSNDVRRTNSAPLIQLKLQNAIEIVRDYLPEVIIFVSGINPRKGSSKEVSTDNEIIRLVNEFAKLLSSPKKNLFFVSTAAIFNIPHPNALQRYKKDDKQGRQLNSQGQKDLLNWITSSIVQQYASSPNLKKRNRSRTSTPQSSEKFPKSCRLESDSSEVFTK